MQALSLHIIKGGLADGKSFSRGNCTIGISFGSPAAARSLLRLMSISINISISAKYEM
jgi:hypothetical protein